MEYHGLKVRLLVKQTTENDDENREAERQSDDNEDAQTERS